MIVLILSAAPASLRGSMTRWLLEVSSGVFVGHLRIFLIYLYLLRSLAVFIRCFYAVVVI